ncbi:exopolyphosphatase [Bombiscardovia nodaiensis]|uniref:Exopolyphosphatase n=1 Tax=Bombiscardovia nodaiensis TaxID=2932181 RepID=A0ABM8B7M3_9BIFI|nr:exopolyphosphatase [Bombiscardovia nodaiensis]
MTHRASVTVAGVDCGTNSIRLMVAQVDEQGLHPLRPRLMRVVRLGEGVDRNHRFSQGALERTFAAAREFAQVLGEYQVDALRFVATSASRDASNRAEFEAGIHEILGVEPQVIAGTQEAQLSFLGAVSVLEQEQGQDVPAAPYLVVDLGGGSTELVAGADGLSGPVDQVQAAYSMNIGSVRMTERHLRSDPPTAHEIEQAQADIDEHITQAFQAVPVDQVRTLIGVSGTVTTMSAIALGLDHYERQAVDGARIALEDAQAANRRVLQMSRQERAGLGAIHPGRIDVIGGGALVWSRLLERLRAAAPSLQGGYVASEHGLLDGLVLSLGRDLLAGE